MRFRSIALFPLWRDVKKYNFNSLWRDFVAAISVALLALPQAMAYAFVAELPPSTGIYAAVFGTIFTASFGTSRYLIAGPTTAIAILIQSGTAQIMFNLYRDLSGPERDLIAVNIVMQIVLLIGLFQVIAGFLKLGRVTQFASRSVVIGYMLGVSFAIVINQLCPFFGLTCREGYQPLYMKAWDVFERLPSLEVATTLLGVASLAAIIALYRISKKIPAAVIVFALAGLFVHFFSWDIKTFEKVGQLYNDPLYPRLPRFEISTLIAAVPIAFAIALVSILEGTSIGRFFTRSKEPPYRDNQEIYALGIGNLFSGLFGGMPSSGSFSRTALNRLLGAKTHFSAIYSGVLLLVMAIFFGFVVVKIPIAAISALLFYTAYTMINFRDLLICVRATPVDAFVVFITFIASLIFTFDVALYIGIAVSIVLYLKKAGVPRLIEYGFNNVGKLRPIDPEDERSDPRICILQAEGELFFGAADLLQSKIRRFAEDESIEIIILQLFNVRDIDASICITLRQTLHYLRGTKRHLLITGVSSKVRKILRESGLASDLGKENLFMANEQLPSEPTRNAYAFAKSLL